MGVEARRRKDEKFLAECPESLRSFVVFMNPPKSMSSPQYLLLLHQPNTGRGPTPAQMQEIMARFGTWMEGLYAKGIVAGTNGLEPEGKVLREPGGAVITDGPYAEAKEIVGGYILINAKSLKQAVEIARGCPGLHYRLAVEVRPVKQRPGR